MNDWLNDIGLSPEFMETLLTYTIRVTGVVLILFLAFVVAKRIKIILKTRLTKTRLDQTLSAFLATVVYWVVLIIAFVSCLGIFGVETTSFAAVLGGTTLAIGLAFQGSLANVAAGVMLLVFRPYRLGDVIEAGGVTGKVVELGLFFTSLDTLDNRRVIIPNGSVFGEVIENKTFHETRRCDVEIGVGYGEDIAKVRVLFEATAAKCEGVLAEPAPRAYLCELGGSSVDFSVRVHCKVENYWDVKERVMQACKEACDAEGVDIPYPHRVVITPGGPASEAKIGNEEKVSQLSG